MKHPNFLSYAEAEANYNAAQSAIAAAARKRAEAFATVEKCLILILKALFVFDLVVAAAYPTLRVSEYFMKLNFLQQPADGNDEFYGFTYFVIIVVAVLGLIKVVYQQTESLTVTNIVKLVGVRNFVIIVLSHVWSEFAINKMKSLALVTTTSLIYSVFVMDIGIDRFALDTGFVEASLIVSMRFMTEFWEREEKTQTEAEHVIGQIAFGWNICLCLTVYVLKWISPTNYVSLEVFVTHQKVHELEATITDLGADLADLRNQLNRRRTKPAQPHDPSPRKNLRYRKE